MHPVERNEPAECGAMLLAAVAGEGSGAHPWLHSAALNAGSAANRNVADLLHHLAELHCPPPGLIEQVAACNAWPGADGWLRDSAAAFADERSYLARLIVAAGPAPGTPGGSAAIAAIADQRRALATVAASDRFGCGIGAVAALGLDWQPIRATLDTAAYRLGVEPRDPTLPVEERTAALLASLPVQPGLDRGLMFGARQLLAHHNGLWDLLEVRAAARG